MERITTCAITAREAATRNETPPQNRLSRPRTSPQAAQVQRQGNRRGTSTTQARRWLRTPLHVESWRTGKSERRHGRQDGQASGLQVQMKLCVAIVVSLASGIVCWFGTRLAIHSLAQILIQNRRHKRQRAEMDFWNQQILQALRDAKDAVHRQDWQAYKRHREAFRANS